jgi:hypothetical protein
MVITNPIIEYSTTVNELQQSTLLQSTQFKVILRRDRFPNIEFFAQTVQHPSVDIAPSVLPFRHADTYQPGDKLVFGDLMIDALMDENMFVYKEIYEWLDQIVQKNIKSNDLRHFLDDTLSYDLRLLILDSNNNVSRTIVYKDAFPTVLGNVMFQASTGNVNPVIMPITFRYSTFEFA